MTQLRRCPSCDSEIPADAPQGLCPKCLLQAGMSSEADPSAQSSVTAKSEMPPESPPTAATPTGGFVPPPVEDLAQRFPQLEILELIGRGGMGAVYKARQPGLDRLVALKVLPPEVGRDPAFAERFQREARSLARLNHPHIVAVYDFGQSDGLYYFVMEFVEGATLRQVIAGGELTSEQALAIVPQICDALQYAHDEGIVHRDIKPENVLLDRKGRVKIADFGLAKLLGLDAGDHSLTLTQQVMGTPHYMAPEQLRGTHAVDHRADIYSLGVVFYELLTGELPLGRFAPPSKKVEIDVRLDEVVLRALEREPQQRYQRASEVKTDIESIGQQPGQAVELVATATNRENSPPLEQTAANLRNPAAGLILAGAATVLLSLGAAGWMGIRVARIHSTPTEDKVVKDGSSTYTYHPSPERPMLPLYWSFLAMHVLAVAAGGLMILGGATMPRLQFHGLAMLASILAMVPLSPAWPISFGLGYMALVWLRRPRVRLAFDQVAAGNSEPPPAATSLVRGFTKLSWAALVCAAVGILGGFLPWAYESIFGIQITAIGVDVWYGWLSTGLIATAALAILAMCLFQRPRLWCGLVALLAGVGVLGTTGWFFQMLRRGPQITASQTSVTGDLAGSDGLVDSLRNLATSWIGGSMSAQPGAGLPLSAACGALLLVLGLSQLVASRRPATGTRDVHSVLQRMGEAMMLAASVTLLTAIGIALWWSLSGQFDASATRYTTKGMIQWTFVGIAIIHTFYAAFIGSAGYSLRRLRARMFVLLCALLVGLLVPATLALNVIMEWGRIPPWPAILPLWLAVPVNVWVMVLLFRQDVRAEFAK